MGEVWLAQDSRLGRKVAIKVLPVELAADPERLARFEQEARAAAALNHPHIAVVHDFGTADGTHYMVQEYLQGQTLRQALEPGALPLESALQLATEVAEALQAAHAAGIVHRDLKPDNVFVSTDGHAKVLDFGLAKLTEAAAMSGGNATMSPTVLGTEAGVIMGTAGYMAPEQVHGQEVDRRADLFAFGCLLYEMVAGARAFAGETVIDSLHAVTRTEPEPLRRVADHAPTELQRIVDKCLRKDPARRCQHADDLAVDLRALAADVESGAAFAATTGGDLDTPVPAAARGTPPWVLVVGAALMLVVGAATAWITLQPEARPPAGPVRFTIELPAGETDFSHGSQQILAVSPDGRHVVFVADRQLWLRSLDEMESVRLPDTVWAGTPVFSPDSRHVAFADSGRLMRIALDGDAAVAVGDLGDLGPQGLSWARDGFIYAGVVHDDTGAVVRFPETGGEPEIVVELGDTGSRIYGPQLIPGGGWLLFTLAASSHAWDSAQVVIQSLSSSQRRVLVDGAHDARVTGSGHLIYAAGGALLAQSFDTDAVEALPGVVPVLEHVRTSFADWTGAAFYSFSDNGTLVSVSGQAESDVLSTFSWIDREGKSQPLPIEAQVFHNEFALSPDGRFVAASRLKDGARRIWIYPVDRPGGQRLTTGPSWDPVWSEDGDWIYYSMGDFLDQDIGRRRSDLSGPEEDVLVAPGLQFPDTLSPDGAWLYFVDIDAAQNLSISRMSLRDGLQREAPEPQLLVGGGGQYYGARLSPDGRYMVMQSDPNATDEDEIVVLDLETQRRWRVSGSGWGRRAAWSASGDAIVYNSEDGVMIADVTTEPEFSVGVPRMLFPHRDHLRSRVISRDDQRYLVRVAVGEAPRIGVVLNWFQELKERLAAR